MIVNRQRTTNNGQRTKAIALARAILFLFLCSFQFAFSQEKESPVIVFKQRMLHQKHDDNFEKVDSFSKLHLMIAGNIYQTEKHTAYAFDKATGKYDF